MIRIDGEGRNLFVGDVANDEDLPRWWPNSTPPASGSPRLRSPSVTPRRAQAAEEELEELARARASRHAPPRSPSAMTFRRTSPPSQSNATRPWHASRCLKKSSSGETMPRRHSVSRTLRRSARPPAATSSRKRQSIPAAALQSSRTSSPDSRASSHARGHGERGHAQRSARRGRRCDKRSRPASPRKGPRRDGMADTQLDTASPTRACA